MSGMAGRMLVILAALGAWAATSADAGISYDLTDLGTLGGTNSFANGINNAGEVVGSSFLPANSDQHPFLYVSGTMHDLGVSGSGSGINTAGEVTGTYRAGIDFHAFVYSNGGIGDLGSLGGLSEGVSINDSGDIAGYVETSKGGFNHAALLHDQSIQDLGTLGGNSSYASGINNAGQIVGHSDISKDPNNTTFHAFLYANGTMRDLGTLGGDSMANGINQGGEIVGAASPAGNERQEAVVFNNGSITDLGNLGGMSNAQAVNDLGQVVGFSFTASGAEHGVLYSDGRMMDLNDLLNNGAGWTVQTAQGINDRGQIAAAALTTSGAQHAVLLTAVPLPSTAWMGLVGLIGSWAWVRRHGSVTAAFWKLH